MINSKFILVVAFYAMTFSLIFSVNTFGQGGWKIGLGNNLTEYQFRTTQGLQANYFKLGSGTSAFISSERSFLDTTRFLGGTDNKSIYFQNNRILSKLLSNLYYELGVSYNQYNALGDIQSIGFRYQTNYLGLVGGIGTIIPIYKGFSVGIKGKMYVQKLLQGIQELNSQFIDLQENNDFNKATTFLGGAVELNKRVNKGIILFMQVEHYNSMKPVESNVKTLNFSTSNFAFGIKFIP